MSSVESWCREQGITCPGGLAFFFSSYEEAAAEGGEQVAQAWLSAQTEVSGSHAGLLLDLYSKQDPKVMPSVPDEESALSQPRS